PSKWAGPRAECGSWAQSARAVEGATMKQAESATSPPSPHRVRRPTNGAIIAVLVMLMGRGHSLAALSCGPAGGVNTGLPGERRYVEVTVLSPIPQLECPSVADGTQGVRNRVGPWDD